MSQAGITEGTFAHAASAWTIGAALRTQVVMRGGHPALQHGQVEWTYAQLNERVNRLAHVLVGWGIGRGDRIAVLSENRSEYVELDLATAKLGAIVACLNWRQADAELTYCIRL